MAGQENFADMEAASSTCKEGPVLTLINRRLRALKKKCNKISQIEECKAQGKQINKEQEEVLKGKLAVNVLVEEYEKLRQPLMKAVKEEIEKELMEVRAINEERSTGNEEGLEDELAVEEEMKGLRLVKEEESATVDEGHTDVGERFDEPNNVEPMDTVLQDMDSHQYGAVPLEREVSDLLHLLYFAQLFDVPRADASPSLVWTKVHERSSCVSYDLVTEEDSSSPLTEDDLNDLSRLGSLITARALNETISHRDALQQCARHALLWLTNSDTPIVEGDVVTTYSHLKEKLHRILTSEYYTMTPELQTFGQQAAGRGQYQPQLYLHASISGSGPPLYYANQDGPLESLVQGREQYPFAIPMENFVSELPDSGVVMNAATVLESESNIPKDVAQVNTEPSIVNEEGQQHDLQLPSSTESAQSGVVLEPQERLQDSEIPTAGADSRGYEGQGGVAPSANNHARARNHLNGRGGHGSSRGGNGSGQGGGHFHDQRGYYPRNQYGRGSGRATRASRSSTFNGYANGQANNRGGGATPS